jgi:hypothetical protein
MIDQRGRRRRRRRAPSKQRCKSTYDTWSLIIIKIEEGEGEEEKCVYRGISSLNWIKGELS